MATYEELRGLFSDDALRNRIEVACIVAAEAIRSEDPGTDNHANRRVWAAAAFNSPGNVARKMMMAVLAANRSATVPQISGSPDTAVQTAVDNAVDLFATG